MELTLLRDINPGDTHFSTTRVDVLNGIPVAEGRQVGLSFSEDGISTFVLAEVEDLRGAYIRWKLVSLIDVVASVEAEGLFPTD